ncbi:MAG: ABC transporter permease subunit [Coriobacteriia bacterium]|jgi:ABC-2 type transport system permease protein|nr:ABC transporter permease subunit [Coriobacteriia bacterium]
MNRTIFRSMLDLRRTSLLWYSFGITVYGWFMVAFYPSVAKNAAFMQTMQEVWPETILDVFGGAGLDLATLGGFLGLEYLSLMWVFIVGTAAIMFAAGALGGSVDDGTMEITLAQPVSRMQIVSVRYLSLVVYTAVLNLVTVASLYVAGLVHGVDVPLDGIASLFALGWLVSVAIGSVAYALSAHSATGSHATSISLGVLVTMWFADVLGTISDRAEWLSRFTLFHYWKPASLINEGVLPFESLAIFGVATLLFLVIAVVAFLRRDVV